jgi:type IV secretory pathway VirB9-like protein
MRTRMLVATLMLISLGVGSLGAQVGGGVREVTASDRSLVPLHTKIRFTTMILLPEGEEILDVVCGDRDFWVISAAQNVAHVKPAKEGASTNLNLVTASGIVYSFLLSEGKQAQPDLKVYVTADPNAPRGQPKYYSATQMTALQTELTQARAALQEATVRTTEAVSSFRQQYPGRLEFAYGAPKYERPFFVRSIWHDGEFTYIKTDARELPALYEVRDGEPALVNFQVQAGTYVVPKILERGYLALGNQRFPFQQGR